MSDGPEFASGRPVVLRGGTVLTMDDAHQVLALADVLVVEDRIAAVGPDCPVRRAPRSRRARRHRHARHDRHPPAHVADGDARLRCRLDLTQYFVWYYLESGGTSAPRTCGGQPAGRRRGRRRRCHDLVDWSHGLQTVEHAEAAVDALRVPGRFVLAYGNIQQAPGEWSTRRSSRRSPAARSTPPTTGRRSRWPST